MGTELDDLRAEASRLEVELEKTRDLNRQAAAAGLQLLNEKEELTSKVNVLQQELETAKHEIDVLAKTLEEFQSKHKAAAKSDLLNEEALLAETSAKEREYQERINTLEDECRQKTKELENNKNELDRLQLLYNEVRDAVKLLEEDGRKLKKDLKEVRESEQRLNADREDLELENIGLQKQVASLKSGQVEFESMKITYKEKDEEIYFLKAALEENEKLKAIAVSQMEEALLTAQQEREQRLAMKRELEAAKNAEHMSSLNDLMLGFQRMGNDGGNEEEQFNQPAGGGDLFSELQGSTDSRVSFKELTLKRFWKGLERF